MGRRKHGRIRKAANSLDSKGKSQTVPKKQVLKVNACEAKDEMELPAGLSVEIFESLAKDREEEDSLPEFSYLPKCYQSCLNNVIFKFKEMGALPAPAGVVDFLDLLRKSLAGKGLPIIPDFSTETDWKKKGYLPAPIPKKIKGNRKLGKLPLPPKVKSVLEIAQVEAAAQWEAIVKLFGKPNDGQPFLTDEANNIVRRWKNKDKAEGLALSTKELQEKILELREKLSPEYFAGLKTDVARTKELQMVVGKRPLNRKKVGKIWRTMEEKGEIPEARFIQIKCPKCRCVSNHSI
jgi:hypothetical protein